MKHLLTYLLVFVLTLSNVLTVQASSVSGTFYTGGIELDLKTYTETAKGKRRETKTVPEVELGQQTPYIISISNLKNEAWVRLKIEYSSQGLESTPSDAWLVGIDRDTWVKRGDYWYNTEPMVSKESVDFCTAISVPRMWSVDENAEFRIRAQAEAVQREHVEMDFTSDNPFEGILIEDSDSTGDIYESGEIKGFEIQFESGAETIVDTSNMFEGFGSMLPGDTRTGTITIRNKNEDTVKVTLKEESSEVNEMALKAVRLTIVKNGGNLYDGAITDQTLQNGISLGDFESGAETEVDFTISLPLTLSSTTAFQSLNTRWTFDVERIETEEPPVDPEKPEEPEHTLPSQPEEPTKPSQPTDPTEPSKPAETEPSKPTEPTQPSKPAETPTKPSTSVNTNYGGGGSSGGPRVSAVATTVRIYSDPDPSIPKGDTGGSWKQLDDMKWEYNLGPNSKAKDGWIYLYNPYSQDEDKSAWFHFDENGIMTYGWIKTKTNNWYFCHDVSDGNLGKLKKGWHEDQEDKRTYFLDRTTGMMLTGWQVIDNNYYYFAKEEDTYRQNWFWNTSIGRWIYDMLGYRTFGSMYVNEKTPDKHYVDAEGKWDGKNPS